VPLVSLALCNSGLSCSLYTYQVHSLDPADTSNPRDTNTTLIYLYIISATLNMKGHHPSSHVPVGATDKSRLTNHDWTSVYGPDDYDYSAEEPLIPVDPTYCPATPEYRPPSSPYRLVSPAYCPASPLYPPASPSFPPTSPNYRPGSPTFSSNCKVGYNGRFHTPCPDHVVLESSDEYEFYISRALLAQAR
jgi:hypothetical protein